MKNKLFMFIASAVLLCACESEVIIYNENLHYADAINALDWGTDTVPVFGHATPDADATCSAMAYAALMNAMGHPCKAYILGNINRETAYAAQYFGFAAPSILDSVAAGQRIILMDHSEYIQSVKGAKNAKILQVIDHHGLGDIKEASMLYYKALPIGATSTIVYNSFKENKVQITNDIAKILLTGILSDTKYLTNVTTTKMDSVAHNALVAQLHLAGAVDTLYRNMQRAARSYDGMTDEEIFLSDSKDYDYGGHLFAIGNVSWYQTATIDAFLDRMLGVMPTIMNNKKHDIIFCKVDRNKVNPDPTSKEEFIDDGTYILYYGAGAKEIAEKAFGKSDREGVIYSAVHLGRKADVVPAIYKAIDGSFSGT